jgi:hypothetical protein
MRIAVACVVAIASLVVVACATATPGWHGTGVHLIDGTWIGVEQDCASGVLNRDLECRTVRDEVLRTLPAELRGRVTRAAVAVLPTTFVTASGETRAARLERGIDSLEAVVLDLSDGTCRVIAASCLLLYDETGLRSVDVRCDQTPLDWWIDGGAPPSIPPGAVFG